MIDLCLETTITSLECSATFATVRATVCVDWEAILVEYQLRCFPTRCRLRLRLFGCELIYVIESVIEPTSAAVSRKLQESKRLAITIGFANRDDNV